MRHPEPLRFFKPNIKYIYIKKSFDPFHVAFSFLKPDWFNGELYIHSPEMLSLSQALCQKLHRVIHTYSAWTFFRVVGLLPWVEFSFSLFFIKNNEVSFFLMVDTLFDLGMVLFVIGSCEEKRQTYKEKNCF